MSKSVALLIALAAIFSLSDAKLDNCPADRRQGRPFDVLTRTNNLLVISFSKETSMKTMTV